MERELYVYENFCEWYYNAEPTYEQLMEMNKQLDKIEEGFRKNGAEKLWKDMKQKIEWRLNQ